MKKIQQRIPAAARDRPGTVGARRLGDPPGDDANPEHRPASCREFVEDLTGQSTRAGQTTANPAGDLWYMVYRDEEGTTHTVKGTTENIRRAYRDRLLGDASNIRACRTKAGPFQPLHGYPEFRDLVIDPDSGSHPGAAGARTRDGGQLPADHGGDKYSHSAAGKRRADEGRRGRRIWYDSKLPDARGRPLGQMGAERQVSQPGVGAHQIAGSAGGQQTERPIRRAERAHLGGDDRTRHRSRCCLGTAAAVTNRLSSIFQESPKFKVDLGTGAGGASRGGFAGAHILSHRGYR